MVGEDFCFACDEDGSCKALSKRWRGVRFHLECFNVSRCYLRLCKTKKAKDEEQELFRCQPKVWRSRVQPFIVKEGVPTRSQSARLALKSTINVEETYVDNAIISDQLLLTKTRSKKHMAFWEDLTPFRG